MLSGQKEQNCLLITGAEFGDGLRIGNHLFKGRFNGPELA
jgi:hypothetical protein